VSCLSTEELAGLYDGVFSREKSSRLRDHLAMCQRCCHEFGAFFGLRKEALPDAFWGQVPPELVLRAIEKRPAPKMSKPGLAPLPHRPRITDK